MTQVITEKYRPATLNDLVLSDENKRFLENWLANPVSHLLFCSKSPGTGKTSAANALAADLGASIIKINTSNERGRKAMSELQAISKNPTIGKKYKIIVLDECDGYTQADQKAALGVIEASAPGVIFIGTANNLANLSSPFLSRFRVVDFKKPVESDDGYWRRLKARVEEICKNENISFSKEVYTKLVRSAGSDDAVDIRKIVTGLGNDVNIETLTYGNVEESCKFALKGEYSKAVNSIRSSTPSNDVIMTTIRLSSGFSDKKAMMLAKIAFKHMNLNTAVNSKIVIASFFAELIDICKISD